MSMSMSMSISISISIVGVVAVMSLLMLGRAFPFTGRPLRAPRPPAPRWLLRGEYPTGGWSCHSFRIRAIAHPPKTQRLSLHLNARSEAVQIESRPNLEIR